MFRLMLQRSHVASATNEMTNRFGRRLFFVDNIIRQERVTDNIGIETEILRMDRTRTDNLLLSPEMRTKKQEKTETAPVTESKPLRVSDLKTLRGENVEGLTKSNMAEQLQDSLIRTTRPQVALTTTTCKLQEAVPFEDVPGPLYLKVVSNMMKYIPVIGNNTFVTRNIRPFKMMFDTYGDIVCLRVPFCGDIVMVHKPEHISEIYKQRNAQSLTFTSFDSLTEWHNRQNKNRFDAGITITQDIKDLFKETFEEKKLFWSNTKYHSTIEKTSEDFLKRIYTIRTIHDEVPSDFQHELYMWGIECMMQTLFATNIGFYQANDVQAADAQRLLRAFLEASDSLQKCESGVQMWRVFNTRSWERLTSACEIIESVLTKHMRMSKLRLDIALKMMMENKNLKESTGIIKSSLVKALILSGCVQPEQILTLCLDMMLVGVTASATSLGFIFYHLAKHPKIQQQLFNEVLHVLPEKNSVLQLNHLGETPLLHGCVTESLRLKHPIPYSLMCLPKTIVLNKYRIPAGTYVMTANEISCLEEENFDDPSRFKPERWLNQSNDTLQDVVVPLSEGTRSFLGRDWLHQQLAVATAKVVRNFVIGYNYGEIKTNRKILSQPNKPFKFTFIDR